MDNGLRKLEEKIDRITEEYLELEQKVSDLLEQLEEKNEYIKDLEEAIAGAFRTLK